jgi:Cu(I)/Ag(I) efflux system membrane protein CusA/SilA
MIARVIDWSGRNRTIVWFLSIVLIVFGLVAATRVPLDAIPDLSDPQVIVFAEWMGRSPELVEDQVTYPLVTGLQSLPGTKAVRGFTMFGMSFTYVLLDQRTDPYWARSRVLERIQQLGPRLPADVEISLGPDASAVGWVYQYALIDRTGQHTIADLRALQDWTLRFELESVPGVAEVATVGGLEKQYQVVLDPERLRSVGLRAQDVVGAVARSNRETGGRVIESAGRELYVQGRGYLHDLTELETIPVGLSSDGTPVPLSSVASVEIGPEIRRGIADLNGEGDVTGGLVIARQGQNALEVIDAVKARISEVHLPDGVEIVPVYDRSTLIRHSVRTLFESLAEEVIVVAIVIGLFMLHLRSILVPVIVLPAAIALSFVPMWATGLTVNIMSLAGIIIAVGDMVDAVVLLVENAARRIEREPDRDRTEVVLDAAKELGAPLVSSLLLIAVSFLPIFTLQAQEGRLFVPLALTKTFAMLAAAIFTVTLAPALAVTFLRGHMPKEQANPLNRLLRRLYRPVVGGATKRPIWFVLLALFATVATIPIYRGLGREFMPPLYEESLLFMPITISGISAEQAKELLVAQDKLLKEFPEVLTVFGKAGKSESATDPAPLSMIETILTLKPQDEWRPGVTPESLVHEMEAKLEFPGVQNAFTMPIKARVDMLTTGIRTPVGVKVLGKDLAEIDEAAQKIEMTLRDIEGTRSVYAERQRAAVFMDITPRRDDLLRYGAVIDDVLDVIDLGLSGMPIGRVYEGRERYSLIARFGRDFRADEDGVMRLPVSTPMGIVPLGSVADVERKPGPAMLVDEGGLLAAYIYVDPGDRDLGGYVDEAKKLVETLGLPDDLKIRWTGQYEFLERAQKRMAIMVPVTVLLVFLLTYMAFRTVGETAIVLLTLPFAVLGSIWFLAAAGYNLSIAAWVSMIALIGIGAETGTVLAVYLDLGVKEALARGETLTPARLAEVAADSAAGRMRGLVLAIAMNVLGLIPVLFATGVGSDMTRRMAGPMFGGLLTLTFMTSLVLPSLWVLWRTRQLENGTLEASLARSKAEE